jgi:thiol-disulfide isomerase/thioredoxin
MAIDPCHPHLKQCDGITDGKCGWKGNEDTMRRSLAILSLLLWTTGVHAAAHLPFTEPQAVAAVTFNDATGGQIGLDAFRDKVMVLDFWATWCAPCRQEFPALDRLQADLGERNVVVVPVSVDAKGLPAVTKFYADLRLTHLAKYLDVGGVASQGLGLRGLPTALVIDRQGREVARIEGPVTWDDPVVEGDLLALAGH